uniref:Uncharacterized protein n=1 Tax=Avena sativa TaxID=4498 RepID=A0ACD5Z502_AVESA
MAAPTTSARLPTFSLLPAAVCLPGLELSLVASFLRSASRFRLASRPTHAVSESRFGVKTMARSTRSAATERAYRHFAPSSTRGFTGYQQAPAGGPGALDEFDESDVWGSFHPAEEEAGRPAEAPRVRTVPAARPGRKMKPVGGGAAHGSLPVAIPDWSKILGDEYQGHQAGEWELDDADDEDVEGAPVVPPHELAWRRRAASLSVNDGMGIGRMLKVRDAVWKKTGFQA